MIPLLLSDSRQMVEYKIWLDRKTTDESEALSLLEDYRDYYAGKHALLLSDDQKAFLEGIITSSEHYPVDNKCRVVVDRLRALLDVEGVEGGGEAVRLEQAEEMGSSPAGMMATWWRANHMNRWEKELYRFSLRDGEAYVMSWHDGTRPRMTVHQMWDGDTGVRMFYEDPDTKTTPMYASRHWYYADPVGEVQGVKRVTVYTSNGVYKYVGMVSEEQRRRMTAAGFSFLGSMTDDGLQALMDPGDPGWPLAWVDRQGQPLGLAVAPFVCPGGSVLAGLIGLNNALNKVNVDILALADQQGFGQIVVQYDVLPEVSDDPTQDSDGLGLRPGRVFETTGQVSKLQADDMGGLLATTQHWTTTIAGNSFLPMHAFIPITGTLPSGVALEVLESGQTDRAEEMISSFSAGWQQVFELCQRLEATFGRDMGEPVELSPVWKPIARQDPAKELQQVQVESARLALERERAAGEGLAMEEETE
jgi:hypothetical protein